MNSGAMDLSYYSNENIGSAIAALLALHYLLLSLCQM